MNEEFEDPRLAAVYDPLDPDRSDLDPYLELVERLGARRVLDLGCGTGVFALLLAQRGLDVIGVDPAAAILDVARRKPGAERVCWIEGDATSVRDANVDLVTMTANVAMVLQTDEDARATLGSVSEALRPAGQLVFETRRPDARAWERWNRNTTSTSAGLPGGGRVESWVEVDKLRWPFLDLRNVFRFDDGTTGRRSRAPRPGAAASSKSGADCCCTRASR